LLADVGVRISMLDILVDVSLGNGLWEKEQLPSVRHLSDSNTEMFLVHCW